MNQYFEQMVLSASPVELIRLLYQKAITSTRNAREHLRNKRVAERCSAINNAYMVLGELAASLRPDEAPDLARRLEGLYMYMQKRLIEANMRQQDEPLADVLSILSTLAEPWNIAPDVRSSAAMPWAGGACPPGESGRYAISA